ncbi:hypothetical protein K501DRAFT_218048 [Backusella circina FSU 941]|nr:hypothetical protein K501DRAFT_218048 [Backusella circina FSU 941]
MHLGLLTQERLSFDPIKPLILRGPPTETSSSVFTGTVVLSLARATKISSVIATFKSTATTYWPEGIGARGTRLTYEKVLGEQSIQLKQIKKNDYVKLPAGIHRFPFAFIVPNSMVETIEDVYGKVRHTIDARATGYGIQLLNNWHISKPVLVLRTYMSDSFLTNNSLQDLSRTYEKHLPAAHIQLIVERAAFSSGELFYIKFIVEPQRKRVRLEHVELVVTETRRYHVSEMRANRKDSEQYVLPFLVSHKIEDGSDQVADLRSVFSPPKKNGTKGIELIDTLAHRITFGTPSCMRNIHHTTHYKDILFKHHLSINITLSYLDDTPTTTAVNVNLSNSHPCSSSTNSSTDDISIPARPPFIHSNYNSSVNTSAASSPYSSTTSIETLSDIEQHAIDTAMSVQPPPPSLQPGGNNSHHHHTHIRPPLVSLNSFNPTPGNLPLFASSANGNNVRPQNNNNNNNGVWLPKIRKPGSKVIPAGKRRHETIHLETPVTVFDCRLKEDYGRLPSYSELNVTARPIHGDDKSRMLPDMLEQDLMLQCIPDSEHHNLSKSNLPTTADPQPQLCPCYFKFRRQMEMASQAQLLSADSDNGNECTAVLEKIPSIPPPDYVESIN